MMDRQKILGALKDVRDPEIGMSITDLEMVREITVEGGRASVTVALTVATCPLAGTVKADIEEALMKLEGITSVDVQTTYMTKEELSRLAEKIQVHRRQAAGQGEASPSGIDKLSKGGIRSIIAIISGKGGVGKSFVTALLAIELRRLGYDVGILDADITGPSIPKVFGLMVKPTYGERGILPVETELGIKAMSINLVIDDPTAPAIWRGPIINSVIRQMYGEVDWGDLHFLLVDLPPGCIASDSLVFANPHPALISQLKPGDHVYSASADISSSPRYPNVLQAKLERRKALEVIPQGEAEVFELRTKSRRLVGTFNHPVLALERVYESASRSHKYRLSWRRLGELRPHDIVAVVKKLPEEGSGPIELPEVGLRGLRKLVLPSRSSDDFTRIAGYFLGDGFLRINRKTRTYQVLFAEPREGKCRQRYIQLLKRVFKAQRIYEDDRQFGLLSKGAAMFFERLGLSEHALTKSLPEWAFKLPASQKLALIEGYCDADGHRRSEKKGYRRAGWMAFESVNRRLIEDIRALCIATGLSVTNLASRTRRVHAPSGMMYTRTFWSFEGSQKSRSSRYGATLIRGSGRQSVGRGLENEYIGFERVTGVKHIGRQPVYDLQVEGNQNFVVDGLIVHNTSDAPLTVFQSLPVDGVVVVTTPQDLALMVVGKAMNMARRLNVPILGLIENMSYVECPDCRKMVELYGRSKGAEAAKATGIPFLGSMPIDPRISGLSDEGRLEEYHSLAFSEIAKNLRISASQIIPQPAGMPPIAWARDKQFSEI